MKKVIFFLAMVFVALNATSLSFAAAPDGWNDRVMPSDKIFVRDRVLFLEIRGNIDYETAKNVEMAFWTADANGLKKVVFEINSGGGDVVAVFEILARMNAWVSLSKERIMETRAFGTVASSGFLIFANGSKGYRFASKFASLALHQIQASIPQYSVAALTGRMEGLKKQQELHFAFLAKVSGKTVGEIKSMIAGDTEVWMSADEAITAGFADHLME